MSLGVGDPDGLLGVVRLLLISPSWILQISFVLENTLAISMSLGVGDPDGLLGVVRLLLISPLDLQAGNQKLGGIWLLGSLLQFDMAGHVETVESLTDLLGNLRWNIQ